MSNIFSSTHPEQLPLGPIANSHRYPVEGVEAIDKRFSFKIGNAPIERIATGCRWAEGPVYFADGGYFLWSDIPNNRILRWLEADGHVSVYRAPSNYANGATRDREGRLISCEHGRRVTRTELDGSITVIMDSYQGRRLNAPNDVVVAADGAIWFTDPGYGIDGNYEGDKADAELPRSIYRVDPASGDVRVVADDFHRPNGLAFSPDESRLYVVDSGITHGGPAHIRVFDVGAGYQLSGGGVFAEDFAPGFTDGVRVDIEGNVWCSMGWGDPAEDGVRCYAPDGDLIGKVHLPETCANLCFGGRKKNRLFMAASTSIYAVYLNTQGAHRP